MKKSELRKVIKEEIQRLNEQGACGALSPGEAMIVSCPGGFDLIEPYGGPSPVVPTQIMIQCSTSNIWNPGGPSPQGQPKKQLPRG